MQKKEWFFELIRRQEESGFSVKEFCNNEGIAESTFYYWSKKRREEAGVGDFIPLVLNNRQERLSSSGHRRRKTTDFILDSETHRDQTIELVYPNGVVIRVGRDISIAQLRLLIRLL